MVEEKISKSQSQRKRRHERETCINNLKLNVNISSKADYTKPRSSKSYGAREKIRNPEDKYARGSLDNVSRVSRPEQNLDEQSTLRRTRSLAISRENLFYSLDYTETSENRKRRSQLIPRAKLIEKSFIRDFRYESFQVENVHWTTKRSSNKPPEIPPDYSPLPRLNSSRNSTLDEQVFAVSPGYTTQNNSLFATVNKNNNCCRKPPEDLSVLSLPNYYPDSEITDNISLTDQSNLSQEKLKYPSLDNLPWETIQTPDSITYDENILLAKKTEGIYAKPRTIRGPIPFKNFDYQKLPQFKPDTACETDEISETTNEQQSSLEFETNTNCDEIRLNNENIRKEGFERASLEDANQEYGKLKVNVHQKCLKQPLKHNRINSNIEKLGAVTIPISTGEVTATVDPNIKSTFDNRIKTLIEVTSDQYSEEFKSIVTVDDVTIDPLEVECRNHSHNYLKEFLETQKGSKRPLQSFIAKKFSNLTRRNSKSNLATNQFYSLPDINISKNLRKCEKIDKKLRKCEKIGKLSENFSENRFIVNIGNHFDITSKRTAVPVDFQVKISKIHKKDKKQTAKEREIEFREAVKNINNTLQTNGFSVDLNNNKAETGSDNTSQMDPEIQEKVDNMRNYWTKMVGDDNEALNEVKEAQTPSCKIVETHRKVDSVKKKFEPSQDEIEDKERSPNKIQLAKLLFEPMSSTEKENMSPIIKETCNYFENKPLEQSNCFESLCPSAVELLDKNSNDKNKETSKNNKPRKTLAKARSINVPEFDHVRYKVIKPELFNKKILANCDSADQFEDLMKYLKDYSFQELFIDNNIVIIEPIRSKVPHQNLKSHSKSTKTTNGFSNTDKAEEVDDVKQGIRKHFFYQPIRVNKEVNDNELPNPEVVRQARQFFENGVLSSNGTDKERRYRDGSLDPDKDICSTSSTQSTLSEVDEENMYDSLDDCCTEYVSEDILEKIREYGTTVTYYGGRVVDQHEGQPILTKVIMEEIKNNEKRCMECSGCRRRSMDKTLNEVSNEYQGLKFKLVKSNSCNSRLELVGTPNKNDSRKMNVNQIIINKMNTDNNNKCITELENDKESLEITKKHAINESIKLNGKLINQPQVIGQEMKHPNNKYIQWSEIKNERCNNVVQFNDKGKIRNYDYREKVAAGKKSCDMEFEPYEVA